MNSLNNLKIGSLEPWLKTGILILLLIVSLMFFSMPQYRSFQEVLATKKALEKELSDTTKDLAEIDRLTAQLGQVSQADLSKINTSMPANENLEELLDNMHRLSQQSGLLITNMYVQPNANVTEDGSALPYASSQLNISLRGRYINLLAFLELIERNARLIDIQTLAVSSNRPTTTGASPTEVLNVTLNSTVYYLQPVPESPLFPFGNSLNLSILENPQFEILQIAISSLPDNLATEPNPFSPK